MRERFLAGDVHGMLEQVPRACMHTCILHVYGMCMACMHRRGPRALRLREAGDVHGMLEHAPHACMHNVHPADPCMCIAWAWRGGGQCDHNPSYDDIEQQGRDEEERWFDDDD